MVLRMGQQLIQPAAEQFLEVFELSCLEYRNHPRSSLSETTIAVNHADRISLIPEHNFFQDFFILI
jgi:hypothetical protein